MVLSRQVLVECVHQWGSNSVVESLLDPACSTFSIPNILGFIGFYENHGCAVVFGDPVCSLADRDLLTHAFHIFCEKRKKNIVYLVASEAFAYSMHAQVASALIPFGEELFLDPQQDPRKVSGKRGISLRGKLRHAIKGGLVVKEYPGNIPELEQQIQNTARQWIQHRKGPQVYISRVHLFTERFGKRWFYAVQEGQIVGCLVLNQIQNKKGWALDRIMTIPRSLQGTSEFLVISVLEKLAQEGCRFITFGAINNAHLGKITGFGTLTSWVTPLIYKASLKFFNLEGKRKFWEKFQPQSTPAFLIFKKPRLGFHELRGLMHALNVSFSHFLN
jgi:lysylphosphatidylglycerol synthetase-like protein (DUF2156 family)